ncbi:lytic transglycosylase domain-containing protein [Nocardia mexicana]|uniref:Transglycosylase-like protein with SLT domain n=1 Tax=Nocardia mexicana TaxID=279262 RepID=A0A370HBE3_9NOCA|nr:transglycosylase SLT domain-containing protein [Nocardia mexicana]RDI51908.1 transglycosylase-like protein with SLT domain [Nocardia mexicana]
MTLTIPDVESWNPDQLTTASVSVGKLSADLDQAVLDGVTRTRQLGDEQQWSGAAAQAASTRMDTEKVRASAVSQAVLQLQTALSQQVENLNNAKQAVRATRDRALHPAENPPPDAFEVSDTGVVTANARKTYWDNQSGLTPTEIQDRKVAEDHRAATLQTEITNALKQAELVSEAAVAAINAAKAKVDEAYAGLGDPATGAGAAPPAATAPAATAPAAVSDTPATGHTNSHSGSSSSTGGTSHSGGSSYLTSGTGGLSSGSSGGPVGPMPTGTQAEWIKEAIRVLREQGYDIKDSDAAIIAAIIEKESGGNPHAINNWDSNAAAGTPSKGLMQTIDSTFNSYALPGHGDIWNPVDNIIAASRYSLDRYGSLDNVPGIAAMRGGGSYVGY